MLSKLLKYDLKSLFKVFIPMWLALLAVSLVNRFTLHSSAGGDMPTVLAMMLYVGLVFAVIVVAIVLIILRFYHGLLKDEGYLMFTLPVKPWQLVSSKCLSALIISILSLIAGTLSVCIIVFDPAILQDFAAFFHQIQAHFSADWILTGVLCFVLLLAGILVGVMQTYASMALGHLAGNHRIGWSVGAFIGINFLFSTIAGIFGSLMDRFHISFDIQLNSHLSELNLGMTILLVICLIQIAIFFVVTERILSKKLNLE